MDGERTVARSLCRSLSNLSEIELSCVLEVLRRDEDLRQQESSRIEALKTEIETLKRKVNGFDGQRSRRCPFCSASFGWIFDRGDTCPRCKEQRVCNQCQQIEPLTKRWTCPLCHLQQQYYVMTGCWLRGRLSAGKRTINKTKSESSYYLAEEGAPQTSNCSFDEACLDSSKLITHHSLPLQRKHRSFQTLGGDSWCNKNYIGPDSIHPFSEVIGKEILTKSTATALTSDVDDASADYRQTNFNRYHVIDVSNNPEIVGNGVSDYSDQCCSEEAGDSSAEEGLGVMRSYRTMEDLSSDLKDGHDSEDNNSLALRFPDTNEPMPRTDSQNGQSSLNTSPVMHCSGTDRESEALHLTYSDETSNSNAANKSRFNDNTGVFSMLHSEASQVVPESAARMKQQIPRPNNLTENELSGCEHLSCNVSTGNLSERQTDGFEDELNSFGVIRDLDDKRISRNLNSNETMSVNRHGTIDCTAGLPEFIFHSENSTSSDESDDEDITSPGVPSHQSAVDWLRVFDDHDSLSVISEHTEPTSETQSVHLLNSSGSESSIDVRLQNVTRESESVESHSAEHDMNEDFDEIVTAQFELYTEDILDLELDQIVEKNLRFQSKFDTQSSKDD